MRIKVLIGAAAALGASLMLAGPAIAAGVGNVQFQVSGTLGQFPCPAGCSTTFTGNGSGAGHTLVTIGGVPYDATFTILGGNVTGGADYSEPGAPFCPLLGSATNPSTGTVTLTGGATGIIYRTSSPTLMGTVYAASTTLTYTYQRVGTIAALTITSGSITVSYFYPGTGQGSFTQPLLIASGAAGAGTGVFQVDAGTALARCSSPGPLPFTITGDAVVAGS